MGQGKDRVKEFEGFLTGAKYGVGADAKKKRKGNTVFQFESPDGERMELWGNASINSALLGSDGKLDRALGAFPFIRVQFVAMRKAGKGKNPQCVCDVFVDDAKKYKKALVKKGATE